MLGFYEDYQTFKQPWLWPTFILYFESDTKCGDVLYSVWDQSLTAWNADYPNVTPLFITSLVYTSNIKFKPQPRPNSIDIGPCILRRRLQSLIITSCLAPPSLAWIILSEPIVIILFNHFNISDLILQPALDTGLGVGVWIAMQAVQTAHWRQTLWMLNIKRWGPLSEISDK